MSRIARFGRFWWEFVAGDDWRAAAGVVVAVAVTALVGETSIGAWWVLPVAVVAVLYASLRRAVKRASSSIRY